MTTLIIEVTIAFYLATVLLIGTVSHRLLRRTGEDYFVASRTIGPFVLLMSLFGTHMTAFSILGASGETFRIGVGVFGLMASSSALVGPAVFFLIGTRLWAVGKRHGYLTQIQYFRERWQSDALGVLLFVVLVGLMVPYLLIGVMGGGVTIASITEGRVPSWVGGLTVCAVIFIYINAGGLRGTAWVNTFQTSVFMVLGAITFAVALHKLGGLDAVMTRLASAHPELLVRGDAVPPLKFLSYMLIPMSVAMFPHIFMHWLSARSARSFRIPMIAYPICLMIVWIPSVLLGLMGKLAFPELAGPAANSVVIRIVGEFAPGILGGLLAAGVVAAIMSSLDSQTLAVGTIFTQDIVRHHGFGDRMSEDRQVLVGRIFVLAILLLTFTLSLFLPSSIFKLAIWSFSGFAALLPVVVAALFWRRSTAGGAIAAVATTAILWIAFFLDGWEVPGYTVAGTGLMPVAVMMAASALAMVVGSLATRPPDAAVVARFFPQPKP